MRILKKNANGDNLKNYENINQQQTRTAEMLIHQIFHQQLQYSNQFQLCAGEYCISDSRFHAVS